VLLRTRDSNQRYRLTDAACSSEDIADSSISRSSVERPVNRSMKRAWCSTRDSWTAHVGHGLLHGVTDARCPLRQLAPVSALGWNRTSGTRFRRPIPGLFVTGEHVEKALPALAFGWSLSRVLTRRFSSSRAIGAREKRTPVQHRRPHSVFLYDPVERALARRPPRRRSHRQLVSTHCAE